MLERYVAAAPVCEKGLHGRRSIYTSERDITVDNVLEVLSDALSVHSLNRREIDYLHGYVRGIQPIIDRQKKYNAEICNRVVENRANEIVTFKTANFIGEPLQYVSRGTDDTVPEKIELLNSFMLTENKASKDVDLAHWMFTCGVGYRLVLNDKAFAYAEYDEFDEAPFEIYTLDPRDAFVVRWSGVSHEVVMGVVSAYVNETMVYTVYTRTQTFTIQDDVITGVQTHNLGRVPVIEYPCNTLRMGAFEVVIEMLDAINTLASNRVDGVEQFIQAIMVFENAEITSEQFAALKDQGALMITSKDGNVAKVYYLNEQLDQSQTQVLVDDMWQTVKEIVGIPSQGNANTGDSSNNGAIIMKNGWSDAEARAKETDSQWRHSETEFLKVVFSICKQAGALDLKVSQVEMRFMRRAYEDLLTKTQAFTTLMGAGCPPLQAFKISGVVVDSESAALQYEQYQEAKEASMQEQLRQQHEYEQDDSHSDEETDYGAEEEETV